jgi:hypothetical protein
VVKPPMPSRRDLLAPDRQRETFLQPPDEV